ncbi:5-oxoprolinase subunit PxpA [Flammeovirga agarivorans]|uniref:5-oxoprolinase subunit PxpA n=1 Tax=Flammeovirga agarivorans TaxID=2726742 RepID=A0A7X8SMZ2_9BACT|nr:5-oxoprolinase subunit PxpA [Flammeovirga agarivorans]NLR93112.1 5-oxoprolinase subunit PxpA [Flammeovirga agarivorans]
MKFIDLNADLGEGFPYDEELLQLVSSCNIACGGHAGTTASMSTTIALAKKYHVTIGAHPSYPDKENFGRKVIDISTTELKSTLTQQIQQLIELAKLQNINVEYIKPHGALYNKAMVDISTAEVIAQVVLAINPELPILGMPNSELEAICLKNNITFIKEGFADRKYTNAGQLVARSQHGAVIHSPTEVWEQIDQMISLQQVNTIDQLSIDMKVDSICFHGDTPEALALLKYVHQQLTEHSSSIQSFIQHGN